MGKRKLLGLFVTYFLFRRGNKILEITVRFLGTQVSESSAKLELFKRLMGINEINFIVSFGNHWHKDYPIHRIWFHSF
jgi:hypothetical protein